MTVADRAPKRNSSLNLVNWMLFMLIFIRESLVGLSTITWFLSTTSTMVKMVFCLVRKRLDRFRRI